MYGYSLTPVANFTFLSVEQEAPRADRSKSNNHLVPPSLPPPTGPPTTPKRGRKKCKVKFALLELVKKMFDDDMSDEDFLATIAEIIENRNMKKEMLERFGRKILGSDAILTPKRVIGCKKTNRVALTDVTNTLEFFESSPGHSNALSHPKVAEKLRTFTCDALDTEKGISKETFQSMSATLGLTQNQQNKTMNFLRGTGLNVVSPKELRQTRASFLSSDIYEKGEVPIGVSGVRKSRENLSETRVKEEKRKQHLKRGISTKLTRKDVDAKELDGIKSVPFARIKPERVEEALCRFVQLLELQDNLFIYPNISPGTLAVLVGFDKGGDDTKLVATIANTIKPTSSRATIVLATFEGNEDREVCEKVFGPIFVALTELFDKKIIDFTAHKCELNVDFSDLLEHSREDKNQLLKRRVCGNEDCNGCEELKPATASSFTKIKFFVANDMKAMNMMYGISTATSVYPCVKCEWIRTRTCTALPEEERKSPMIRRISRLYRDNEERMERSIEAGKCVHAGSCIYKSVTDKPMPPNHPCWDPNAVATVMPLHNRLGVGDRILRLWERVCALVDSIHRGDDEAYTVIKDCDCEEEEKEDIVKTKKGKYKYKKKKCSQCKHRMYNEQTKERQEMSKCFQKLKVVKMKSSIRDMKSSTQRWRNTGDEEIEADPVEAEVDELHWEALIREKVLNEEERPLCHYLDTVWNEISAHRQAFYSGAINGNDVKKIFDEQKSLYKKFLTIPKSVKEKIGEELTLEVEEMEKRFLPIFDSFAVVSHFMSSARPLCVFEIDTFKAEVDKLQTSYLALQELKGHRLSVAKQATITPKLHYLFAHACAFLDIHRSIGMFSEEGTERLHVEWNKIHRDSFSNRKGAERLLGILERYNSNLISFMAPRKPRVCPSCKLGISKKRYNIYCVCKKNNIVIDPEVNAEKADGAETTRKLRRSPRTRTTAVR